MDTTARTDGASGAPPHVSGSDFCDGLRDIVPVLIAAVPIGTLFGALSVAKGLSVIEVGIMSLTVFAGGAQFAAMELWTWPVPIAALAFSTLLVNARHVLMGASLAGKMAGFSPGSTLGGMFLLTDEAWALAERRAMVRPVTPAYWFGLGGLLPLVWTGSGLLGAWLGGFLGDPAAIGADFAFTALFIGLIAGFWKGRGTAWTIIASGAASALTYVTAGSPWHVATGALAGIAAAWLAAGRREAAA